MAPLETAPAEKDTQITAAEIREKALKEASTVGDYIRGLDEAAKRAEQQKEVGEDLQEMTGEQRADIANVLKEDAAKTKDATAGNEDLHIDQSLSGSGEQGNAQVGGGRGTINVNPDAVERIAQGKKGENAFVNLAAHEDAHATQQQPMGDIELSDDTVTAWELHENHSESKGAQAEGKSAQTFHRDGQPEDYAQAQEKGKKLRALGISDTEFDEYIAEGGQSGTRKLQARVVQAEIESANCRSKRSWLPLPDQF